MKTAASLLGLVSATALCLGLLVTPAAAGETEVAPITAPAFTAATQRETVTPVSAPTRTCRIYGSSSGFGLLCSDGGVGKTLAQQLREVGINGTKAFCWDDPDLPDGFVAERDRAGEPGRWYLHTCLDFGGGPVIRDNVELTYAYDFHAPDKEQELTDAQRPVIESITGRGQIPFLQVQTSPISSPRVDQDVAFSMLCDAKVRCVDTPDGRQVRTPLLPVGGVTMFAELIHLRVLPLGDVRPVKEVNCTGAGLPMTAEQLDRTPDDDRRVCRWRYERSSNGAGTGTSADRYPAKVTAFWQIFVDDGSGPRTFGLPYEKTTTNQIRVTEVQTLVVS